MSGCSCPLRSSMRRRGETMNSLKRYRGTVFVARGRRAPGHRIAVARVVRIHGSKPCMKSCRGSWCVLRGRKLCQRLRDESDLSELYTAPDFVHNVRMAHGFRQGEHICSLYDTEEEQLATAAAYLADGLSRGERGLYIGADRNAVLRFRTALGAVGLDAA